MLVLPNDEYLKEVIPGYSPELTNQLIYRLQHTDHFIGPETYDYYSLHLDVIRGEAPVGVFVRGGIQYCVQHKSHIFHDIPTAIEAIKKWVQNIDDVISGYMVIVVPEGIKVRFMITPMMRDEHNANDRKFKQF